jgi:hypothetical protein
VPFALITSRKNSAFCLNEIPCKSTIVLQTVTILSILIIDLIFKTLMILLNHYLSHKLKLIGS